MDEMLHDGCTAWVQRHDWIFYGPVHSLSVAVSMAFEPVSWTVRPVLPRNIRTPVVHTEQLRFMLWNPQRDFPLLVKAGPEQATQAGHAALAHTTLPESHIVSCNLLGFSVWCEREIPPWSLWCLWTLAPERSHLCNIHVTSMTDITFSPMRYQLALQKYAGTKKGKEPLEELDRLRPLVNHIRTRPTCLLTALSWQFSRMVYKCCSGGTEMICAQLFKHVTKNILPRRNLSKWYVFGSGEYLVMTQYCSHIISLPVQRSGDVYILYIFLHCGS